MIRRVRVWHIEGPPKDGTPWVADWRSFDIPETVAAAIRNASPGLVAISIRPYGGRMMRAAERAARQRGIRILWVPFGTAIQSKSGGVV